MCFLFLSAFSKKFQQCRTINPIIVAYSIRRHTVTLPSIKLLRKFYPLQNLANPI